VAYINEDRTRHGSSTPASRSSSPLHQGDHRRTAAPRSPAAEMWDAFAAEYLPAYGHEFRPDRVPTQLPMTGTFCVQARLATADRKHGISGEGKAPSQRWFTPCGAVFGIEVDVLDYAEHAWAAGEEATAVRVMSRSFHDEVRWGVGMEPGYSTQSVR